MQSRVPPCSSLSQPNLSLDTNQCPPSHHGEEGLEEPLCRTDTESRARLLGWGREDTEAADGTGLWGTKAGKGASEETGTAD